MTQNGSTPEDRAAARNASGGRRFFEFFGGGWWETVKTVFYAVVLATLVRTFAYEPFHIPSGSMIPTLLVGDYLFVSKLSYGYSKYSFPFAAAWFDGRVWASEPERGDVIVFKLPRDNETDYIKRLIGLPGDRIQVMDEILYINGRPVERRQIDDYVLADRLGAGGVRRFVETLPNGVSYQVIERSRFGNLDNTAVFVVPDGHYFFMGDNRDGSQDSRRLSAVGYVPYENLVGRAEVLFFSLGGRFWEPWNWRVSRFGNAL